MATFQGDQKTNGFGGKKSRQDPFYIGKLMKIPITQSESWQKLQDDLGEKSFFEKNDDFSYLAILKTTPVGNYLYCPYGPVAENKKNFEKSLDSLCKIGLEVGALFIRIEPTTPDFMKNLPKNTKNMKDIKGIKKSQDLNPKETWILDLKTTEEELKKKLPSRLFRYYRNAEKNGLKIEKTTNPEDIKYLISLQKALADKKGINVFSEKYLKTEASQPFSTIYLVKKDEECLAAGLVFDDENTRYNLQGAQSEQGRNLHATGILTIKLILDAYEKNLKTFDFWGIAPENAPKNHPWAGFTEFKKSFGGAPVEYAGDYDLILKPLKYRFYELFRKINRKIRR